MKKKLLLGMLAGFLAITILGVQTVSATTMTYKFTITAADLMNYVTVNGADGSSALDNGLYEGARLLRLRDGGQTDVRSYHSSTNVDFASWAETTTDRLVEFNLWGYDGRGINWGEIYKVDSWGDEVPTTNNSNWTGDIIAWPWGTPPANNDGQLLGWDTDWSDSDLVASYASGMGFDGSGAGNTFTFQVTMDMDDPAFYGETSPWYNGVEGQMVLWFGGWMLNDTADSWTGLYEGNIILQGTVVPEPATMLLFGIGLLGIAGVSRRKK